MPFSTKRLPGGLTDPWRIRHARRWCPVRYVVFDLLYHAGRCLLREPLARRREVQAAVCQRLDAPEVRLSEAVIAAGTALYAAVVAQGHEGVAATAKTRRNRQGDPSCAELPEGGALERELAQRVGEPPGTSSDPRYASVLLSRWHS